MADEAWIPLETRYDELWAQFDALYSFRAGVSPAAWPAINEPKGSTTFDLSPIFARPGATFSAGADAINAEVLNAFVLTFPADESLLVLDWQHTSAEMFPHRQALLNGWPFVAPFPNGDYYTFLTRDMQTGTFGHPWEQTLCVFGEALSRVLVPVLSSWLPIKRQS